MTLPPNRPALRVFDEETIARVVDDDIALRSAKRAFAAIARGHALMAPPVAVELPQAHGEVHVKGAYISGSPIFAFKVATGFYGNVELGVPTGSGLVLVFDSETGFPIAVLADNGYLTDLRTAAAGALAVRHLAPERPLAAAVLGAGVQARHQIRLIRHVRNLKEVRVWSRKESSSRDYVARMGRVLDSPVRALATVAEALNGVDLVITTTPSRVPLVLAGMLSPGVTVVAMGSDGPDKQEIAAEVLAKADKIVTDVTDQCVLLGELHHAVAAGLMSVDDVHAELGQVVEGSRPGREGNETIMCDLTGVGAQDAAIAEAAYQAVMKVSSATST